MGVVSTRRASCRATELNHHCVAFDNTVELDT